MNDFFTNILLNLQHFNLHELGLVIQSPKDIFLIMTLFFMEIFLSIDNALVLAIMVKHLPPKEQKKALKYGIVGAYTFRLIAITLGLYLVKIMWIKLLAALYLAKIVFDFFRNKDENQNGVKDVMEKSLIATIISVELADIAFSVDSVVAAFGISDIPWVIAIGGMVGILAMRGIAQLFVKLVAKIPELETTAHVLIGIISLKMFLGVFSIHPPEWLFFATLISTFVGTFFVHQYRQKNISQTAK